MNTARGGSGGSLGSLGRDKGVSVKKETRRLGIKSVLERSEVGFPVRWDSVTLSGFLYDFAVCPRVEQVLFEVGQGSIVLLGKGGGEEPCHHHAHVLHLNL